MVYCLDVPKNKEILKEDLREDHSNKAVENRQATTNLNGVVEKQENSDDKSLLEKSTVNSFSKTSIESSIVKPTESPNEHESDSSGKVESQSSINTDMKKSDEKDKLMDLQKMIAKEFDLELKDVNAVENNEAGSNTETTEVKNDKEVEKSSSVVNESESFCLLLFICYYYIVYCAMLDSVIKT